MPQRSAREQSATPPPELLQASGPASAIASIPRTDCGDFDIRIAADGTWLYRDSPIGRPALVKLFATVLKRDAAGDYWLETPAERGRIAVEDAPFVAVEADYEGEGERQQATIRTNIDQRVTLGEDHPLILRGSADAPRPYVALGGGLEALVSRNVFYGMVERAAPRRVGGVETLGLWSGGRFFALEPVPSEDAP
ncbi:MAG: DUF1285 domain-containing protein [Alphaproteobacteria bacterium]